tara:strand:+ start:7230 stop:7853 length:624 start_codon:yes stop_codon:yes gene_type:complete
MFYIVDDFYPDPDKIRKYALSCTFHNGTITDRVTNKIRKIMHPGARTKELDNENFIYLKNRMEQLLNRKIVRWYSQAKINCVFNLGIGDTEPNWVHHDSVSAKRKELAKSQNYKLWAGVIYLTPNAPLDAGTSLWIRDDGIKIAEDSVGKLPKGIPPVGWTKHASASNIYNRLVLYRGDHYHAPDKAGFGNSRETGRLTQLIVFMTE